MFLQLAYKELQIVAVSKKLVQKCYETAQEVPEEKTNLSQQLKQAVLAAHLSISQGAFKNKKKKGRKYFKSAQQSLVLVDAVLELILELGYASSASLQEVSVLLISTYQLLGKLIRK